MKTVFKPLISVLGGEAGVRIANLCFALLIARVFGAAVLGIYAACIAVVTVATMFAENGLHTTALLELSGRAPGPGEIAGRLYLSKTILTLVTLLILAGIGFGLHLNPFVWMVASWVTFRTVLQSCSQLHMSFLKARSRADAIGPIQFVHALFLLLGIFLTYKQGWALQFLLAWFTAGQLGELVLTGLAAWRAGIWPTWPSTNFFWPTIRRSMPLGIGNGLANAIIRFDTIVLAALVSPSELGSFSAANTLLASTNTMSRGMRTAVAEADTSVFDLPKMAANVSGTGRLGEPAAQQAPVPERRSGITGWPQGVFVRAGGVFGLSRVISALGSSTTPSPNTVFSVDRSWAVSRSLAIGFPS